MNEIKVRGLKEPLIVYKEQAEKVMELKMNGDKDQIIKINHKDGVWVGSLGDVLYIELEREPRVEDIPEGVSFDVDQFRKEVEGLVKEGKLSLRQEYRLLKKYGIAKVRELVDEPKTASDFDLAVIDPVGWRVAYKIIEEVKDEFGKKKFAEKKKLEQLDEVAKSMGY